MACSVDTAMPEAALPRRTKLLWGSAGLGAEALNQSRLAWLVYFYAPPASAGHAARPTLPLLAVTLLLFAGKFIEAFADTLIGHWSDRTSSRLGRRIPFVLLGAPPMALFAVLLFAPPAGLRGPSLAVYFFVALELFFLCNSLVSVPYDALLPEIARTGAERMSLSACRVYFGVLGAGVGLIGSGLLISQIGYRGMALVIALLALAGRYVGVAGVWRRARRDRPPTSPSLAATLRLTLANRGFLVFMLSFVLFSSALAMLTGLLPYYVESLLRERDTGLWAGLLTGIAIGTMALAIPLFARLAHRTSQRHAYLRAMLLSSLAFPLLFVAGSLPGLSPVAQALLVMPIVGAPLAGVYLFPDPIVAALCDAEAQATGLRREGVFYSVQSFMSKLTGAFAPLLLGLILLLGDSPGHLLGIRLVGPVAGLLVLSGYLALRAYDAAQRTAPAGEPQVVLGP